MGDLNSEQNRKSSVTKSHEKIHELLEEIKEFEKEYAIEEIEPEFIEVGTDGGKFIEIGKDSVEQFKPSSFEQEANKQRLEKNLKKSRIFRIRYGSRREIQKAKLDANATTFKIRFDKEGKLVNVDLRKSKPNSRKRIDSKKNKTKKMGKSEKDTGEKSKSLKLKGGLSKIGKLKRVIPNKSKKSEETEELEEEE